MKDYYVYAMASMSRALYTGITSDLVRRVQEHKNLLAPGSFTARYNITRLVYFETTSDVNSAISREKQIKAWRRGKKLALIESLNPDWADLSAEWF